MDDIARFLAEHLPWRAFAPAQVAGLAARLEIEYFPRGARLAGTGDAPVDHLWVLRNGAVDLVAPGSGGGTWRHRLGEGDLLGADEWLAGRPPDADAVAREDVLAYRLPRSALEVLGDPAVLQCLLRARPGQRLRVAPVDGAAGFAAAPDVAVGVHVAWPNTP